MDARRFGLLAALAAFAGCDCGGGATGDECRMQDDCPAGLVCVGGRCLAFDGGSEDGPVDTDAAGEGEDGAGETPCPGPVCGGACCAAGQVCYAEVCCDPDRVCGAECCGAGEVCEDDVCRLDCGEEPPCGDICCDAGEVCAAGGCVVPGDPCDDPYDCPADSYCEATLGRCLPRGDVDTGCEYRPEPGDFAPTVEWTWSGSPTVPTHDQVMMQPIVVPLSDDNGDTAVDERDVPDIVFHTYTGGNYHTDGVLRAISGDGGGEILTVADPALRTVPGSSIAAADLDGDGRVELVTCHESQRAMALEHDGTLKWIASAGPTCLWTAPSIADLDLDTVPEVLVRRAALRAADGATLWNDPVETGSTYPESDYSTAANLDADPELELVAGTAAYNHDGTVLWDRGLPTGYPAVGDLDLDGNPDVALVQSLGTPGDWFTRGHWVLALRGADGSTLWGPVDINQGVPTPSGPGGGGPPTISDFDGDTRPEVAAAGGYGYVVFNGEDGSPLWFTATVDLSSRVTGSSVFDFEGDGAAEVVYGDEHNLHIYRGTDGTELFRACNCTGTLWEYPVIVDVDHDDHAEIVVARNNYTGWRCDDGSPAPTGIAVFGDLRNNWVRTRRIWNQHTYHVTNVNEDGSVPSPERRNWTVLGLNNFRQNVQPEGLFAAPDLVVARVVVDERSCSAGLTFAAWIENRGSGGAPAGIPIAFYEGDPAAGGRLLAVVPTPAPILPGASVRIAVEVPVGDARVGETISVWVRIDDDGSGTPSGVVHECRTGNNGFGPVDGSCPIIG